METISIGTCRLHGGSPKHCASTNVSPHHRLHHHHHMYVHRSHSRVQNLDLMDDLPLPFQTDPHHLSLLVQESPMLSPNPPPSVIEVNGQQQQSHLPSTAASTTATLATGQSTQATPNPNLSSCNPVSNFNNTTTATNTTNVIINNIKTNTTIIGTTNLDSGIVQPGTAATNAEGDEATAAAAAAKSKADAKETYLRNRHWHTCPELHKAMDGVTYIADHTKKEEESTRVRAKIFILNDIFTACSKQKAS